MIRRITIYLQSFNILFHNITSIKCLRISQMLAYCIRNRNIRATMNMLLRTHYVERFHIIPAE
jgi:hypothetical protein